MYRDRDYSIHNFDEMQRLIALDLETTGLKLQFNHVIEICAIEIINLKITGNQIKVHIPPRTTIEQEAFSLHKMNQNFYNDNINNFYNDPMKQLISLINFIDNAFIISHNAIFDYNFLNKELEYWGLNNLRKPIWRCSFLFYKRYVKWRLISLRSFHQKDYLLMKILDITFKEKIIYQRSFSLATCAENLAIKFDTDKLHNAEFDALLTAKVFISTMNIIKSYDFYSIKKVNFKND